MDLSPPAPLALTLGLPLALGALALALGWVGDELAIYDDGQEVVAVWRVRFAEEADAESLSDQVNALGGETGRSAVAFGDDAYVLEPDPIFG